MYGEDIASSLDQLYITWVQQPAWLDNFVDIGLELTDKRSDQTLACSLFIRRATKTCTVTIRDGKVGIRLMREHLTFEQVENQFLKKFSKSLNFFGESIYDIVTELMHVAVTAKNRKDFVILSDNVIMKQRRSESD